MTAPLDRLAGDLLARAEGRERLVVAVAGAPGAGKSTFAAGLLAALEARVPGSAAILPMDGYHYDNAVLDQLGLRARKGAPASFDAAGLARDLGRLRTGEDPVAVPVFDRDLDLSRAGARLIGAQHHIVLVEGNYLLLDQPPWSDLAGFFDVTLFLPVPVEELHRRLVARWLHHGLAPDAARARAEGNDMPNAALVATRSRPADIDWTA